MALAGQDGGEKGIRTLEEHTPLTVFETAAFDRSAISPALGNKQFFRPAIKQKADARCVGRLLNTDFSVFSGDLRAPSVILRPEAAADRQPDRHLHRWG